MRRVYAVQAWTLELSLDEPTERAGFGGTRLGSQHRRGGGKLTESPGPAGQPA